MLPLRRTASSHILIFIKSTFTDGATLHCCHGLAMRWTCIVVQCAQITYRDLFDLDFLWKRIEKSGRAR